MMSAIDARNLRQCRSTNITHTNLDYVPIGVIQNVSNTTFYVRRLGCGWRHVASPRLCVESKWGGAVISRLENNQEQDDDDEHAENGKEEEGADLVLAPCSRVRDPLSEEG